MKLPEPVIKINGHDVCFKQNEHGVFLAVKLKDEEHLSLSEKQSLAKGIRNYLSAEGFIDSGENNEFDECDTCSE
jgi:hypothetical protein